MTMNTLITVSRFRTVIATALFGTVASSFAVLPAVADSFATPQATVKYGDLNVASPEGAIVLYGRIRHAAENVCLQFDRFDLSGKKQACRNNAILEAVTKVNVPALSKLYSAKTGKDVATRLASR
jgi:UrcA family protein